MEDYLKVVVAGEVDAGKSTLIGRFLFEMGSIPQEIAEEINANSGSFDFAYLLDSFEEERKGKLTIDTTQAFCKGKRGKGFVFIDVPGHRELLKNAFCGSAYADTAVLVVDIQKAIEQGTKNHIQILKFLGITKTVVVLNKMDSIGFNKDIFRNIESEVSRFFKATGFTYRGIVPVSAAEGDNLAKKSKRMSWYKGPTLIAALNKLKKMDKKENNKGFYFAVQDNYFIDGDNFLLGPVLSGAIRKNELVKIVPLGVVSRIKKIRLLERNKPFAREKESCGLALRLSGQVKRGQILYAKIAPEVTDIITARIFCARQLNISDNFILKCMTQESRAKIKQVNKIVDDSGALTPDLKNNILDAAAVAEVTIITENPLAVKKYSQLASLGRFVLEDKKEICAAGVIV